jgi:thioredoxin reductase (NADPH)
VVSPAGDEAVAFPRLTDEQIARLRSFGNPAAVERGDLLFRAGQQSYDLTVLDTATAEVLREATADLPEAVVARHGPGRFLGELNLLTGQATYLTARVTEPGQVTRIPPPAFRRLMDSDPELSDLVLRAFLSRREYLRTGDAAASVIILGSSWSAAALQLRRWAASEQIPHTWVDIDTPTGQHLREVLAVVAADLPAVVTPTGLLRSTTAGELAERLGLSYRPPDGAGAEVLDVVVVGAGPAGLAAGVYGASEGLHTLVLDAVGAGGQAAASSRIENYLGFPSGLSGAELTARATVQAQKFGARVSTPCQVASLSAGDGQFEVTLGDGTRIAARSVVVATGARYRSLPVPRWDDFEGAGIYHAATELEARSCAEEAVAVVGGANSAGQAALFLAARGSRVSLVVRGADLTAGMSAYLSDRITAHPLISVRTHAEVTALHGGEHLDGITITDRSSGTGRRADCRGLFCFIGAVPATDWLTDVQLDDHGFVLTDVALPDTALPAGWAHLGRRPLPFETSQPGVFAAGDVRAGSMKRVAAAVGEGASCIRSVHLVLGAPTG